MMQTVGVVIVYVLLKLFTASLWDVEQVLISCGSLTQMQAGRQSWDAGHCLIQLEGWVFEPPLHLILFAVHFSTLFFPPVT